MIYVIINILLHMPCDVQHTYIPSYIIKQIEYMLL